MTALTSIEKKSSDLDDVLKNFPLFGRYYSKATFFVILAYMTNNWYCAHYVFANEEVGYRCKDEAWAKNITNVCSSNNETGRCTEWVYDNPHSFVAEFDLACQEWKRTLAGTMYSFGYMVGLVFVGPLSDRFGRKKVAITAGVLGGVIGVTKSFTSIYWLYMFLLFLESAAGDVCSPFFMLSIEMVASERRILYQMFCNFGYLLGGLSLPLIAYLFPYWRTFLRVLYSPAIFFFLYTFLIDESPRWLLSKGKKDEAITILQKVADQDKVVLDKNVLEKLSYEENTGIGLMELIRNTISSKALLLRFFVCLSWWITSTFVNYGMVINSVSLEGNKYINYALVAAVDLPANVITSYTMLYFKRKIPLITCFFTATLFCYGQPFVPTTLPWLSILLYMFGKLMSGAFFNITYVFTSELFPTYTRNSMHALCSSLGRIGSILAPQTPLLMHYWVGLPSLIFGSVSLIAGLLTFLVPETGDHRLPDTVKQAEALGKELKDKEANEPTINFVIPSRTNLKQNNSILEKTRL